MSTTINIRKDYGVRDLDNIDSMGFLSTIKIAKDASITLDIRECTYDYLATYLLIDMVFRDFLDYSSKNKTVEIIHNFIMPETVILTTFFQESHYFNFKSIENYNCDLLANYINDKLNAADISLRIKGYNKATNEFITYNYGRD